MAPYEVTCIISAILFVISNILGFSLFHRYRKQDRGHFSWDDYRNFDPELIQDEWESRNDEYFWELAAGVLNAIAWMIFCIPLIQVAWIQSQQGTRRLAVHVAIAALALGGSITELISRLMFVGAATTTAWLSRQFNLESWVTDAADGTPDYIGWRVLEVIHIINRGFLLWIDAAEWLFLAAIFFLLYYSVRRSEEAHFHPNWSRLGLLLGVLAFFDFSSEVMRLRDWRTFSKFAIFLSMGSRMVLMPIWLIWLGKQLPAHQDAHKATAAGGQLPAHQDARKATAVGGQQEMPHYGSNATRGSDADGGEASVFT
jgi:hypothetical protein